MQELQNGSLVKHLTLGVGKVVALEAGAVHVFFPGGDRRHAAKLRLPAARALLRTDGFEPDGWLEGLTAFTLDPESGRYALATSWLTQPQAEANFLEAYPAGFADPAYLESGKGRGARWRAGQAAFQKRLGAAELQRMVEEGDMAGFAARVGEIDAKLSPLHPPADQGALAEALADETATRQLLLALAELLAVPSPGKARFDRLFTAARALPADPGHQWLAATLLPFLAAPDRHPLVRPRVTFSAAERLGCDVRAEPAPNWVTFGAVRALEERLLLQLAPHGAQDLVDVETFLHVTAGGRRTAAKPAAAKAKAKAKRSS